MGASEAELGQDLVGIADEIAIGKEQQLDQVERQAPSRRARPGAGRDRDRVDIYVSHVDIFRALCYRIVASSRTGYLRSSRAAATVLGWRARGGVPI